MRGSWRIGELAGIGIYVHWSFLILPAVIGLGTLNESGPSAAVDAILFILAIFGCVVLHELGHALSARRFGIGTRDITLLPIGGVANLERMPRHPVQELAIALAGPAVNVIIAIAILAGLVITGSLTSILSGHLFASPFLVRLMWANVVLAIFNLLPAFPMDGGRVLRSVLAMFMPYDHATDNAAIVGQVIAVFLGLLGLFGNFALVFVAMFVFFAGRAEAAMVRQQARLHGVKVGNIMQPHFQSVYADAHIQDVAQRMLFDAQQEFPVIDGQRFVGLVTRGDLLAAMARGDGYHPVGEVARHGVPAVDRHASVEDTARRMQRTGVCAMPVTDDGIMVGIVTLPIIQRFLQATRQGNVPYAQVVSDEQAG